MIVDTHLHLNVEDYDKDLSEVIDRAYEKGIKKLIVIGMDEKTSLKAIEIAEQYEHVYASVGLHPGYVDDNNTNFIEPLLKHPKVVAIGETGLDLYWTKDNLDRQTEMFINQIKLSKKHHLPLIIHTRNSFNEAYDTIKGYKGEVTGVFHCFSSNLEDAMKTVDLGFYIGVDGPITFKNPKDILPIVENIDLKHILVETDSPYLAPMPYRGKRNEPSYLIEVVNKIAEIKKIDAHKVSEITTENAYKLFHIGGSNHEK
ncbi:MAG: TatD family hydrolase [Acholeplasmataceae bacterium]|nr:TatD family hydrolase [Acholeplasmataceae bacterium]